MNRFYCLAIGNDEKWHLELEGTFPDGTPTNIWEYCHGFVSSPLPVPFQIAAPGDRDDYNSTAFITTVVSKRLAELWESFEAKAIQRIPAVINGEPDNWEVVCFLTRVDCIDHARSKITYYPENDPERPGKPRGVLKLVIDPARVGDNHIFVPKDWEVVTVVSESVKVAMESNAITGVEYWPVSN